MGGELSEFASPPKNQEENEELEEVKSTLFDKEYEAVDSKDLIIERLMRQVEE